MGNDDLKGTYSRVLIFKGENYAYWKKNMYVPLMCVCKMLWVAITDKTFIPKNKFDGAIKLPKSWSDKGKKGILRFKGEEYTYFHVKR